MSRGLSNDSYTSYSSISTYEDKLSPATPMTFPDMSWTPYQDPDPYQYSEYTDYGTTETWMPEDNTIPPSYYESPPNVSYVISPSDNFEFSYNTVPRTPMMPAFPAQEAVENNMVQHGGMPSSTQHVCLVPGCDSKTTFKRKADLQRHYEQIHRPADQKKQYLCDYTRCERSKEPFHRMDHFRDHYRDFHKEDLPRKSGESAKWYADKEKAASSKHWRCVKCLTKVSIKEYGFQCGSCETPCEQQRRSIRGYK
ncbi:Histidine biosynthesis bifunctional protein hisB [Pestalotiopsis sp. IQ-011]